MFYTTSRIELDVAKKKHTTLRKAREKESAYTNDRNQELNLNCLQLFIIHISHGKK